MCLFQRRDSSCLSHLINLWLQEGPDLSFSPIELFVTSFLTMNMTLPLKKRNMKTWSSSTGFLVKVKKKKKNSLSIQGCCRRPWPWITAVQTLKDILVSYMPPLWLTHGVSWPSHAGLVLNDKVGLLMCGPLCGGPTLSRSNKAGSSRSKIKITSFTLIYTLAINYPMLIVNDNDY